jgi:hypothetical protein
VACGSTLELTGGVAASGCTPIYLAVVPVGGGTFVCRALDISFLNWRRCEEGRQFILLVSLML